jgi:hypothetical protein
MIGDAGFQAKLFDACVPRLRHQNIQNLAGDSSTSRRLVDPHAFNFSPIVVENHGAGRQGFPFRVSGHEETHLGPLERIERKVVIAFWRIEAGRKRLSMPQKLNDIGLSGVFLSDDRSGGWAPRHCSLRAGHREMVVEALSGLALALLRKLRLHGRRLASRIMAKAP